MTYSTLASQMDLGGRFPPARSIPNLPNETCSMVPATDSYALARCSSHPADMWGRDVLEHNQPLGDSAENMRAMKLVQQQYQQQHQPPPSHIGVCEATQTEPAFDLQAMEKFVLANPRLILNILGIIEPAYQIECELQPQTLIPIPEADGSSPETSSPHEVTVDYPYGTVGTQSTPWSPQNSTNRNTENCRSTDALIGAHSSDDCLKASDTSLNNMTETVNFSIIKEGSFKGKLKGAGGGTASGGGCSTSCNRIDKTSNTSNSSLSSSTTANTPRGSSNDLLQRHGSNNSVLNRKHSWKESNSNVGHSIKTMVSTDTMDNRTSADTSDDGGHQEYDELSEKCALLCNDVRKNSRASTTDIQKRTHLSMPRPPFNYRFSAGDADKLEKGIRNIPSTRSLKES